MRKALIEALDNLQKLLISLLENLEQILGGPIAVMGLIAAVLFMAFFVLLLRVFKTKPTTEENDQW